MFLKTVKRTTALSIALFLSGQVLALELGAALQASAGNTMGIPLSAPFSILICQMSRCV
ncbi:hypothetical protein [Acinetobacter sp. TSRC1-2]|uniref:hypothetical protein n=1 Tax=unclassified Acinetobacter TaxID=196816 RepID=UPI003CF93282